MCTLAIAILQFDNTAVNACQEGNNCAQLCSSNNDGTFTCSCATGYTLDQDGTSCNGKDLRTDKKPTVDNYSITIMHVLFTQTSMSVLLIIKEVVLDHVRTLLDHSSAPVRLVLSLLLTR